MDVHQTGTERGQPQQLFSASLSQRNGPNSSGAVSTPFDVLAAVAHDLRLPLSHIKGFVSSLRRADVDWDEETRSEFLEEIDLETDRLADLLDSLLDVRAPHADLAFTAPASVVDGALHRMRGLFGGRRLRIDVAPTLPLLRMDASQMERVLTNLLQNAIKYTPSGTAIGISARMNDDCEVELAVEDEGPGIPPEDRERIFEPFFRKQTAVLSAIPGHGLGLAICQSIVLAHGGRMQVSERPVRGSRFSVFLPAGLESGQGDSNDRPKEGVNDGALHARRGRRSTHAPTLCNQGQRLRCTVVR